MVGGFVWVQVLVVIQVQVLMGVCVRIQVLMGICVQVKILDLVLGVIYVSV